MTMKNTLILSITLLTLAATGFAADVKVVLGGVHNCCTTCSKDIDKAVEKLRNVEVASKGGTVTITAKNKADAKKAVEALNAAGYYGNVEEGESPGEKKPPASMEKKVKSATVSGIHNCCDKCRAAISDAVKAVPGVTDLDVVAKKQTFKVTGDFSRADVLAALNKVGFDATVK